MSERNFDAEKRLQEQVKILVDSLSVLTKSLKESMDDVELTEHMLKQAMDANTFYCRFVSDHFEISSDELSELFDKWMGQFDEEQLEEMADTPLNPYGDDEDPPKTVAEQPDKLWSMDDLLNELNPKKDD